MPSVGFGTIAGATARDGVGEQEEEEEEAVPPTPSSFTSISYADVSLDDLRIHEDVDAANSSTAAQRLDLQAISAIAATQSKLKQELSSYLAQLADRRDSDGGEPVIAQALVSESFQSMVHRLQARRQEQMAGERGWLGRAAAAKTAGAVMEETWEATMAADPRLLEALAGVRRLEAQLQKAGAKAGTKAGCTASAADTNGPPSISSPPYSLDDAMEMARRCVRRAERVRQALCDVQPQLATDDGTCAADDDWTEQHKELIKIYQVAFDRLVATGEQEDKAAAATAGAFVADAQRVAEIEAQLQTLCCCDDADEPSQREMTDLLHRLKGIDAALRELRTGAEKWA